MDVIFSSSMANSMSSDNGLEWLLQFLSKFLHLIGIQSTFVASIASIYPGTLYLMRQFLELGRDVFLRYVVCPKCTKLYKPEQCTTIINGSQVPLRCTHMVRHRRQMKECGHQLVREVILTNKKIFYPLKVYCYNSVIETLERFVSGKALQRNVNYWGKGVLLIRNMVMFMMDRSGKTS